MSKILVIDDDPSAADLFASLLRQFGYTAAAANSGREALDYLREGVKPDLVFLDMMMPEMNGIEVLRHIRSDERTADVPVVMLSALDDDEWHHRAVSAGASDYWIKGGFDFGELEQKVRSRLPL